MNDVLVLSIVVLVFLTYKFNRVFKNKEVSKGNKRIAWSLYGISIIGLVSVNLLFSCIVLMQLPHALVLKIQESMMIDSF